MLPHCSGWAMLHKQVLSSRDSCRLARANGVVASSSPGKARLEIQTIVLPRIRSSSSSSSSSSGAARGSPCTGAARAALGRRSSSSSNTVVSYGNLMSYSHKQRGSVATQNQEDDSFCQSGYIIYLCDTF